MPRWRRRLRSQRAVLPVEAVAGVGEQARVEAAGRVADEVDARSRSPGLAAQVGAAEALQDGVLQGAHPRLERTHGWRLGHVDAAGQLGPGRRQRLDDVVEVDDVRPPLAAEGAEAEEARDEEHLIRGTHPWSMAPAAAGWLGPFRVHHAGAAARMSAPKGPAPSRRQEVQALGLAGGRRSSSGGRVHRQVERPERRDRRDGPARIPGGEPGLRGDAPGGVHEEAGEAKAGGAAGVDDAERSRRVPVEQELGRERGGVRGAPGRSDRAPAPASPGQPAAPPSREAPPGRPAVPRCRRPAAGGRGGGAAPPPARPAGPRRPRPPTSSTSAAVSWPWPSRSRRLCGAVESSRTRWRPGRRSTATRRA